MTLRWRSVLVTLHRWFGLFAATFLFIAGATGAIMAWSQELDGWLNPHWFRPLSSAQPMPPLDLADRLEQADPRLHVSWLPLSIEPGRTLLVSVQPTLNPATGRPHDLNFDQVVLDPGTGQILGQRRRGEVSLTREKLIPFLCKLHYTLHLPSVGGFDLGTWFMGMVGVVWVLDTLIAMWISFPNWRQWKRSFAWRWSAGGHRLVFDLHRSGGVWLFALMLMLAVTSVSMNLGDPVMRPVVSWFSDLTPSPMAQKPASVSPQAHAPTRREVVALAQAEAKKRKWSASVGGVFHNSRAAVWRVGFFEAGQAHGNGGLGNPWLYFDARDGHLLGAEEPGVGTAGDLFMQAMFPLHSGRILGWPGRILMSAMGVAVAALSLTGVLIWARKRRGRLALKQS